MEVKEKHVKIKPLNEEFFFVKLITRPYRMVRRKYNNYIRSKTNIHNRYPPKFLIIGTQKGGTTSLYDYMIQHPSILPVERKEIHYYDFNPTKGIAWYMSFFPKKREGQDFTCGEATPSYIYLKDIPAKVKKDFPDIKLILLLRNPIERALSHYSMIKYRELEKLSFEEAIEVEQQRINGNLHSKLNFSYLDQGLYYKHLANWIKYFPKEQILILESEQFFKHPEEITNQVFKFLGLNSCDGIEYAHLNKGKGKVPLSPKTRTKLSDFFAIPNQKLNKITKVSFSWSKEE